MTGGARPVSLSEARARGHAERLMPMVAEALAAAGLAPADLGAVAVCTGPGNFTGVRIGVAAARGLALALGVPAVGVTRLEALAEGAGEVVAAAPALRGTLYAQAFGAEGAGPLETGEAAALAARYPGAAAVVGGPEAEALAAALGAAWIEVEDPPATEALARVAARRLAAGEAVPRPAPVYPRPPDAAPPSEAPPRLLA